MKTTLTTLIMGLFSLGAMAQQDAGFSMYFFNPVYINPAYAGSREILSGTLVHRSQWAGMNDAPTSQALSIHSAIPNSKVGLGLQVYNDKAGPMKNTGINVTYAYHLPVGQTGKLSFGLTGTLNNLRVQWDEINVDDNDDRAFTGNSSSWVPDAAAGLYYYKPRFYVGLSGNHLVQSNFGLSDASGPSQAKFYRQYYLTSGVVLPLSQSVDLRPSVLVKYVKGAPLTGEIDATFIFSKKFFVGVGVRTNQRVNISGSDNMLIGILQYEFTRFLRFGYAYDYFLNRTGSYNSGTHELMLGWDIGGKKTKMSDPRFF